MSFFDFFRFSNHQKLSAQEEAEAKESLNKATQTLEIDVAIMAHDNWKVRLEAYLSGKSSEDLRPEVIACDENCDLGKWIYSDGHKYLAKYAAFSDLKATHKMFHYTASSLVTLSQAGKQEEAKQILDSDFSTLSTKIRRRLSDLKGLS